MDYGHEMAEGILSDLEKELNEIYSEANESARKKADKYLARFKEQDAVMQKKLQDKQITEQEYKQWRLGKMKGNARYTAMQDALARDMTNTNQIAASAINGHLPDVYASNYNWSTYQIEQDARMDTNFVIYDRQTVERLIRDKPDLLPMKAGIDIPKDLKWNKKHINNAITQGVLLGESIPDIAKRLANVTDMNRKAAIRNARTMTTSAENGGRIDSYKRATDMGIKLTQEWLATKDNRTRHEHAMLDGQEVAVGKPFKVEGYEIRFPADPKAEAFLVYNCRCTLISNFKGFNFNKMDNYVKEKPMTYKEWEAKHIQRAAKNKTSDTIISEAQKLAIDYAEKIGITIESRIDDYTVADIEKYIESIAGFVPKDVEKYYYNFSGAVSISNMLNSICVDDEQFRDAYRKYLKKQYVIDKVKPKTKQGWLYNTGYFTESYEVLGDLNNMIENADEDIQKVWKMYAPHLKRPYPRGSESAQAYYSMIDGHVHFNEDEIRESYQTFFHEFGHNIDYISIGLSGNLSKVIPYTDVKVNKGRTLADMIETEIKSKVSDKNGNVDKDKLMDYLNSIMASTSTEGRADISDMLEPFTIKYLDMDYPLGAGHGKSYYEGFNYNVASHEAFAEMFSAEIANFESIDLIKKEFPKSYQMFRRMLKEMVM